MTRGRGAPVFGRLAVGAFIGGTAWVSLGVVALVEPERLTRVAALPGWPWLAAATVTGAALTAVSALRSAACPPLLLLGLVWLPWLPLRVPGAFLVWDGPLEAAVWLSAVGGAAWLSRARFPSWAWPHVGPARAPIVAALLSAVVFTASWAIVRPRVPSGDEPHYLVIAQSLLVDGDLRIENNHRARHYLAYFEGVLRPDFMQRGRDGEIYSIHAPGTAVVVAPAFLAAGYPGAVVMVIALTALGMALVWRVGFLVSGSAQAAWIGWLAVTTAAPVVLHASTIYPDALGGSAALVGLFALVTLDVTPSQAWSAWRAVGTGAALAALPWLHTRFSLVAGGLGLAVVLRLIRRPGGWSDAARLLLVPVLAAAAWLSYFWIIYGTPNPAAPYGRRPDDAWAFVPTGIAGLLVDQQFGLAENAPVLLVALAALVPLARHRPRLGLELLLIVVLYLVAVARFPMWWGGTSAPARFAVVVLPMLAVPLAWAWRAGPVAARRVIGVTLAMSMAVTAALVGVDRGAFIHNSRDGASLLLDWLSRSADLTLAVPSVHRDGAGTALADFAVWVLAAVVAAAVATRLARRGRPWAGRAAAWLAVPATLMLAATITWAARDRATLTPSTSQMRFLDRWRPDRTPVVLQLAPTRVLATADVPRRLMLESSTRGPVRPAGGPLLQIPEVPAGDYDVFVDGRAELTGSAVVRLGRQEVPLETWALDRRPAGFTGLVLHLPVAAHSITVSGDEAARASIRRLSLRPRQIVARDQSVVALRAARYGRVVVYALDDNAFLEPGALWVRGETAASFVVHGDPGPQPVVRLRAGPVANVVTLTAGSWRREVSIARDESADVALPVEALAPAVLSVASATGFRPSEHTPGSDDVRWLGVYVSWPDRVTAGGAPR